MLRKLLAGSTIEMQGFSEGRQRGYKFRGGLSPRRTGASGVVTGRPAGEAHSGREWREETHERDWREREEHWGRGCPPGLAKQGRC